MLNYETKTYRYLGDAPQHISEEKLLSYFLYAFEFSWNAKAFEPIKENIESYFSNQLKEIKGKVSQPLSIGQEWWALVFIALREMAVNEKYTYAKETVQFIMNRIHTLTDDELAQYANSINEVFFDQMPDVLALRPTVMEDLQSDAPKYDDLLSYFLEKKETFLSMFKEVLVESDIDIMYINQLSPIDKKISVEYTDTWKAYYEIFTGFSASMYQMIKQTVEDSPEEFEDMLNDILFAFAINSITNNAKIESFVSKTTELVLPLFKRLLD